MDLTGTVTLDLAASWAEFDQNAFAACTAVRGACSKEERSSPADLGGVNSGRPLHSHCGSAKALEAHTPPSDTLACLMGSTLPSKAVFGYDETSKAVATSPVSALRSACGLDLVSCKIKRGSCWPASSWVLVE